MGKRLKAKNKKRARTADARVKEGSVPTRHKVADSRSRRDIRKAAFRSK